MSVSAKFCQANFSISSLHILLGLLRIFSNGIELVGLLPYKVSNTYVLHIYILVIFCIYLVYYVVVMTIIAMVREGEGGREGGLGCDSSLISKHQSFF